MIAPRSVRLSAKGQFVIPKEMRDALGIKQGDELLVVLDGKRMILTRPEEHARASRGALKGAWGKSRRDVDRYLERERRSWH